MPAVGGSWFVFFPEVLLRVRLLWASSYCSDVPEEPLEEEGIVQTALCVVQLALHPRACE